MEKDHSWDEIDDLYDQDILTKRKCPECGEPIVICSDCTEYCSKCKWSRK
jgi:hypothetical protein